MKTPSLQIYFIPDLFESSIEHSAYTQLPKMLPRGGRLRGKTKSPDLRKQVAGHASDVLNSLCYYTSDTFIKQMNFPDFSSTTEATSEVKS